MIKKVVCLICAVVLCLVSVVSVSAYTITAEDLKSEYNITYNEEDFPFYVILQDNHGNNYLLLVSNTEFLYVDTQIEEILSSNYLVQYNCKSNGSLTSNIYENGAYSEILTDFTFISSNFDVLDTDGNVYFEKTVEEDDEETSENVQLIDEISTQNEIMLQGFTVIVGMISMLVGILTAKAFSFWKW